MECIAWVHTLDLQCSAFITRWVFWKTPHKRHSIAPDMGCLVWIETLIYILSQSLQWYMRYPKLCYGHIKIHNRWMCFFTIILQDQFTGTGTIVWLTQHHFIQDVFQIVNEINAFQIVHEINYGYNIYYKNKSNRFPNQFSIKVILNSLFIDASS